MSNIKALNGNELFNTSGHLKGGTEAVHKVFETQLGRMIAELKEKKEKCTRLFKATFNKPYSRKRCKQKQKEGNQGQRKPITKLTVGSW